MLKLSLGLRNFILGGGSMREAFKNAIMEMYAGGQPTDADQAVIGTLLVTFTKSGGAFTPEVLSSTTITLTGGASGSINTVTVNGVNIIPDGAVAFNTSLTQTATDLAAAINNAFTDPTFAASAVGAVVTIKAAPGTGATPNAQAVATTLTTITNTIANGSTLAGGVTAVNGLSFGAAAAGVLAKKATETWQGTAVATNTAGWFRLKSSIADAGALDAAGAFMRLDGAVATSGAQLNMASTSIVAAAVQTLATFNINFPTP